MNTHSHGRLARTYRINAQRKQQQLKKTDNALVTEYVAGDNRAFQIIVERHRQRMMAVAKQYARNEHCLLYTSDAADE